MRPALAALLLSLGLGGTARAQGDTFVPDHEAAHEALARGDRALAAARERGTERLWTEALDAWTDALAKSSTGDLVPVRVQPEGEAEVWPDPDGTAASRSEGVPAAVLRRVALLADGERERWLRRFEPLAEERLLAAGRAEVALERVERDLPATRAAALAALRLADRAFEAGRPLAARTWLERAAVHARLAAPELDAPAGPLARRRELLDRLAPAPRVEGWRTARALRAVREVPLHTRTIGVPPEGEGFDRGLIAGGVFLDDGRFVLHHPVAVFVVDEDGAGPIFEPRKLLESLPRRSGATFAPSGQAWPLEPATDGHDLYFVLGRAIVAGNTSAVCRLAPPSAVGEAAHLRWVLSTQGHADAEGVTTPLEELLEPGTWEFQPGPVVCEGKLLVQARQWLPIEDGAAAAADRSRPSCWLVALDAETGLPAWTRFLGKGSDVQRDFGNRFGSGRPAAPAQPLALDGGRVFCATGVGLGALLDVADGRVAWTFLPRRRDPEDAGWVRAHRPSIVHGDAGALVVWGPPDGDALHWLRCEADLDGRGLEPFPSSPLASWRAVLAAGGPSAVLLGRCGAAYCLGELDPIGGALTRGILLRRTERFRGASLASESRVLLATDRSLYLFDRERELLLLESHGLRPAGSEGGGTVVAQGDRVLVLGPDRVFVFDAVRE